MVKCAHTKLRVVVGEFMVKCDTCGLRWTQVTDALSKEEVLSHIQKRRVYIKCASLKNAEDRAFHQGYVIALNELEQSIGFGKK